MAIKFGTNFAIFLMFFALAAVQALQLQKWSIATIWFCVGLIFLYADNVKKK